MIAYDYFATLDHTCTREPTHAEANRLSNSVYFGQARKMAVI